MSFMQKIPESAWPTYKWDWRFMVLDGIFIGAAYHLLKFVARKTIGVSEVQVAIIDQSLHLGMFFSFLIPHLFRVQRKVTFILWTAIPAKFMFMLLAFITDPFVFFLFSCAALFLLRMYLPMYAAILKSNYPDSHRGTIYGHVKTLSLVAAISSMVLVGAILQFNEALFRIIFPIAGIMGIISTLMLIPINENKPVGIPLWNSIVPLSKIGSILKNDRLYLIYQLIYLIAGFANLMGIPIYVLYIVDVLNANYLQIALTAGIINHIFSLITMRWWGRFLDRYPNPMLMRSLLTTILLLQPLLHAWAWDMTLIYISAAVFGIFWAGSEFNWLLGPLYFCDEDEAPAYTMIHSCHTGLRGIIAPIVGYAIYRNFGFEATFYTIATLMFFASVLMYILYIKTRDLPRFRHRPIPEAMALGDE